MAGTVLVHCWVSLDRLSVNKLLAGATAAAVAPAASRP
jgi:hypothetical protein